jgi:hypothetical protein
LRSPKKTLIELEDEKLRPIIQKIFDQSKERFGSIKIRAKLMEQNIFLSTKRINRLMKSSASDMG